jgi:hypothetical protein
MMSLSILAAVAALGQTPAPMKLALPVELPAVASAAPDPTCGGREGMAALAACVATTPGELQATLRAYEAAFIAEGWLVADARGNVAVYVRRRPEGGCESFQALAFADDDAPAEGKAWLAFATVPSDLCQAEPAAQ